MQREAWMGGGPRRTQAADDPQVWASDPSATPAKVNPEASPAGSSSERQPGLLSPGALAQRPRGTAFLQARHQAGEGGGVAD